MRASFSRWGLIFLWALAAAILAWNLMAGGRGLMPDRHEIVVREVDNGYLVQAHGKNNPYAYREYVFTDPVAAGLAVSGLLHEKVPGPQWGK